MSVAVSPDWIWLKMSSSLVPGLDAGVATLGLAAAGGARGPRRRCGRSSRRGRRGTRRRPAGTRDRPSTCTGVDGPADLDLLALVVDHRPHPAPRRAGDDRVADLELALVDEHRGHRAAAGVEVGLEHDALGPTRRGWPSAPRARRRPAAGRAGRRCRGPGWPTSRRRSCRRPTTRARARARRAG